MGQAEDYIGINYGASIKFSYSTCTVSTIGDRGYAGGLIGVNDGGSITDCYAVGDVTATYMCGGLVGHNTGSVEKCYTSNNVREEKEYRCGALIARNEGSISTSFWNIDKFDWPIWVPFSESGTTGLTESQMKITASFAGLDFDNVWNIETGGYPYLRWQIPAPDLAPPGFETGYPAYDEATPQGFRLKVKTDEDADVYFVVLDKGVSLSQLFTDNLYYSMTTGRAENGSDALPANRKGWIGTAAGVEASVEISGLVSGTDYDIYLIAEDRDGNYTHSLTKLTARTEWSGDENGITGFTVAGQVGMSKIDAAAHTVTFYMPEGADVTSLAPAITLTGSATVSPSSGQTQNFTIRSSIP
jgi:hypothetical protein